MNPKIWGRSGWTFLFSIAIKFPERPNFQDVHNYKRFFTDVQYILPCQVCCENYTKHLIEIPMEPYLIDTKSLFTWLLKIHNLVNKQLKKQPITEADAIKIYLNGNKNFIGSNLWNQNTWKFFFSIAQGYPENPSMQDIFYHKRFFTYLQYVLPCPSFKKYYSEQLNQLPIDSYLKSSDHLFIWVLKIHNLMNLQFNAPLMTAQLVKHKYYPELYKKSNQIKRQSKPIVEGFAGIQQNNQFWSKNISLGLIIALFSLIMYRVSQ